MTIEEKKNQRKDRLKKLYEAINNLPEVDGKKMHGEMDVVTFDAVQQSNERAKKVKDSFKEKFKETREFIKDQDKATGAAEEDKSEKRLFLDEELFGDAEVSNELKESKKSNKSGKRVLKEAVSDLAYEIADRINRMAGDDGIIQRDAFDTWLDGQLSRIADEYDAEKGIIVYNGETLDFGDFETDIRGLLSFDGWETDFETGDLKRVGRDINWAVNFDITLNSMDATWDDLDEAEQTNILNQIGDGYFSGTF